MAAANEAPRSERPSVPSPEAAQERWERGSLLSAVLRSAALLDQLRAEVTRMGANFDHLHADVVALREAARVPRPECYADAATRRRARRARKTPPAPEGPALGQPPTE
jgi:hypothetical protein